MVYDIAARIINSDDESVLMIPSSECIMEHTKSIVLPFSLSGYNTY
jgi:hypothetical protein